MLVWFFSRFVWGQSLVKEQILPPAYDWGWNITNEKVSPVWMTIPEASKACQELIKCGCKVCKTRCKCRQFGLECTELCKCSGDCSEFLDWNRFQFLQTLLVWNDSALTLEQSSNRDKPIWSFRSACAWVQSIWDKCASCACLFVLFTLFYCILTWL